MIQRLASKFERVLLYEFSLLRGSFDFHQDFDGNRPQFYLHARVARSCEGLDLNLFFQAINARKGFLMKEVCSPNKRLKLFYIGVFIIV